MPTLTPVEHDPFGSPQFGFMPVDHDPWASDPSASDIASMTHQAEQPNPAAPYLDAAKQVATKGLAFATGGLKGTGVDVLPEWMNTVGGVFQNPDNVAAMGMPLSGESLVSLRKLLAQGKTQRQAAGELGTSLGMVQRTIRAEGLPTDPSRGAPIKTVGEFTPPDPTLDKMVRSLFTPQKRDPYLERLRQLSLIPVDHDPFAQ